MIVLQWDVARFRASQFHFTALHSSKKKTPNERRFSEDYAKSGNNNANGDAAGYARRN